MSAIRPRIVFLARHLLGIAIYAAPTCIMGLVWNAFVDTNADPEGGLWIISLTLVLTLWSLPGYIVLGWVGSRAMFNRRLTIWRVAGTGLVAAGFLFPLFFFSVNALGSWVCHSVGCLGRTNEKVWFATTFAIAPSISVLVAPWISSLFPRGNNRGRTPDNP